MRISYDIDADAAYIYFKHSKGALTTIRLSNDIAIDMGPNQEIRGLEILNAARHVGGKGKGGQPVIELENIASATMTLEIHERNKVE